MSPGRLRPASRSLRAPVINSPPLSAWGSPGTWTRVAGSRDVRRRLRPRSPSTARTTFPHAYTSSVTPFLVSWEAMGVMLSAAGSLQWLHDTIAPDVPFDHLLTEAERVGAGSPGAPVPPVPARREDTARRPRCTRSRSEGCNCATTGSAGDRAVLEGVAFGLRDSLDLLRALGVELSRALVPRVAVRAPELWLEIMPPAVLGLPIERMVARGRAPRSAPPCSARSPAGLFADVHECSGGDCANARGRRTRRGLAGSLRRAEAEVSRALPVLWAPSTALWSRREGRPHRAAKRGRAGRLETPTPQPGEVLVRSHVAGVCRTDLEMLHRGLTDPRWVRLPLVPGHESSGTVASSARA